MNVSESSVPPSPPMPTRTNRSRSPSAPTLARPRHQPTAWRRGSSQCWGCGISAENCNRRTTGSLEVIKVSLETELKTLSKYIGGRRSTPPPSRDILQNSCQVPGKQSQSMALFPVPSDRGDDRGRPCRSLVDLAAQVDSGGYVRVSLRRRGSLVV